MADKLPVSRILIEETMRFIALECIIGVPPLGIADTMGVSPLTLGIISVTSLSAPLVITIFLIVIRIQRRQEQSQLARKWQRRTKWWILWLAVLDAIFLALLYGSKGQMDQLQAADILITLIWVIGMGWFFIRSQLKE